MNKKFQYYLLNRLAGIQGLFVGFAIFCAISIIISLAGWAESGWHFICVPIFFVMSVCFIVAAILIPSKNEVEKFLEPVATNKAPE